MEIDKITAHTLAAHGFRLVDKEGKIYEIASITRMGTLSLFIDEETDWKPILLSQIGTDFWVLKRDFSMLTKSITVEGIEIIPIVELAKITGIKNDFEVKYVKNCTGFNDGEKYSFSFNSGDFSVWNITKKQWCKLFNQEKLFKKLYSLHFIDLPEGTYKLIEE